MIEFERKRIDSISDEEVISELKRISDIFDGKYFRKREFDLHSLTCKSTKVITLFGSWENALLTIGISEKAMRRLRKDRIDDIQLVFEIVRIWNILEHRPSKTEWESMETKYSYTTIKERFLGWTNACNEARLLLNEDNETIVSKKLVVGNKINKNIINDNEKRNIPLKLRLRVLKRDNYKCTLCGRSPSNEYGVELHIDHIEPFSKGGKTSFENLRTLCRECNIGRGNDESF